MFSALYWLLYESMKAEMLKECTSPELTFTQSFIAGAGAGSVRLHILLLGVCSVDPVLLHCAFFCFLLATCSVDHVLLALCI